MSDALSKKLDEIEDLAHADIENEWDDRLARGALALVAALEAGLAVRAWDEESCLRYDEALHAIEELKL